MGLPLHAMIGPERRRRPVGSGGHDDRSPSPVARRPRHHPPHGRGVRRQRTDLDVRAAGLGEAGATDRRRRPDGRRQRRHVLGVAPVPDPADARVRGGGRGGLPRRRLGGGEAVGGPRRPRRGPRDPGLRRGQGGDRVHGAGRPGGDRDDRGPRDPGHGEGQAATDDGDLGIHELSVADGGGSSYSVLVGQYQPKGVKDVAANFDADAAWYTAASDNGWYAIWWPGEAKPWASRRRTTGTWSSTATRRSRSAPGPRAAPSRPDEGRSRHTPFVQSRCTLVRPSYRALPPRSRTLPPDSPNHPLCHRGAQGAQGVTTTRRMAIALDDSTSIGRRRPRRGAAISRDIGTQEARAIALRRVVAEVNGTLELDAVLEDVLDSSQELFGADAAGLWQLQPRRQPFELVASRDLGQELIDVVASVYEDEDVMGLRAMRERRPIVIADPAARAAVRPGLRATRVPDRQLRPAPVPGRARRPAGALPPHPLRLVPRRARAVHRRSRTRWRRRSRTRGCSRRSARAPHACARSRSSRRD